MSDYQVIVVGAGCAGSIAATVLAREGKSVLLIERGSYAGAKNMTGGRIYTHSLKSVFPDFEEEAPLERKITHERISLMAENANTTLHFTSPDLGDKSTASYSVLRVPFDGWLAKKAEEAGADCIYGITVEKLVWEGERIVGVKAGNDEITADITILADGVNSLLIGQAKLSERPLPSQLALGIKETIELSEEVINDRFSLDPGEGVAWLFAGAATQGQTGGGFLYTNRESLSLGLVVTLPQLCSAHAPIYQMIEDFKAHTAIAPLIRGGIVREYSAHLIPEGGYRSIPALYGEGCLVVGDAAMLCSNLGYQVRGMDYAVASGDLAAQTAIAALESADHSAAFLSDYRKRLEECFVLQDLKAYQDFPEFMAQTERIFREYPEAVAQSMKALFSVDGKPTQSLRRKIKEPLKEIGLITLLKDMRKGLKAL